MLSLCCMNYRENWPQVENKPVCRNLLTALALMTNYCTLIGQRKTSQTREFISVIFLFTVQTGCNKLCSLKSLESREIVNFGRLIELYHNLLHLSCVVYCSVKVVAFCMSVVVQLRERWEVLHAQFL